MKDENGNKISMKQWLDTPVMVHRRKVFQMFMYGILAGCALMFIMALAGLLL